MPDPLRILVCGGRDFRDEADVHYILTRIYLLEGDVPGRGVACVIHGGTTGADTFAGRWARANHVPEIVFKPEWKKHGKAAGPLRNARMLAEGKPDLVVAFPGGRGTADMVAKARAAGVEVREIGRYVDPYAVEIEDAGPGSGP